MASKVRRIDFSPDEWLAGTMNLDNAERGLYWDACALIYSHGGPIPVSELKARSRDHGNAFNRQLRRLIALGKLVRNGSDLDNKRCEKELEKAGKRAEKGREMADQRWNNNGLDDQQALQSSNGNLQLSTNNHQPLSAREARRSKNGAGGEADLPDERSRWSARLRHWVTKGAKSWGADCGPLPGEPGCWAPADLVADALRKRNGRAK